MIYHITSRSDWSRAVEEGRYEADSLQAEGFIHTSKPHQVAGVANRLFHGQTDLLLLHIDVGRVSAEIRYEGGADPFPHIYGPLNLDSVVDVQEFVAGPDGIFAFTEKPK